MSAVLGNAWGVSWAESHPGISKKGHCHSTGESRGTAGFVFRDMAKLPPAGLAIRLGSASSQGWVSSQSKCEPLKDMSQP